MWRLQIGTIALAGLVGLILEGAIARAGHDLVPEPPPTSTVQRLQALPGLQQNSVTVSGVSSGGFFAHQFHVAYSKLVDGAGIIAGGPYGCAEHILNPYWWFADVPLDRGSAATVACTHYLGSRYFGLRPPSPRADDSASFVQQAHQQGLIDDPKNLTSSRVWLFHGRGDEIVPQSTMAALHDLYRLLGVPSSQLSSDMNEHGRSASHGVPVAKFEGSSRFPVRLCKEHAPPFVIECGYEAAEQLLKHLYPGQIGNASKEPHGDGNLIGFDQSEFFVGLSDHISLHGVGYIYVPKSCEREECRLHVAFHGCRQTADEIHDDFIRDAGYNRWAATNNIVMLYPQIAVSRINPNGCWDWWGYTGEGYFGQNGRQMRAVRAIIARVLGAER
ncbi:PHB depolymerase family esterase [Methylobacterium durans]|uniref:Poly(3-hydroxybutyrate) depolymerase n=1 Tax=Methylobacterium durans TaxID=2202825 RepID=A0A2U8W335_9HYPH|nr:PHB depolymerase family esterase [Methylobacterium durans]AWN40489.1 hypothetical protein DK389_08035 [Methylobacterium durans]